MQNTTRNTLESRAINPNQFARYFHYVMANKFVGMQPVGFDCGEFRTVHVTGQLKLNRYTHLVKYTNFPPKPDEPVVEGYALYEPQHWRLTQVTRDERAEDIALLDKLTFLSHCAAAGLDKKFWKKVTAASKLWPRKVKH